MAFVVCSAIGLDTKASSADYVQLHGADKATLAESLVMIQETASAILQAIDPTEDVAANRRRTLVKRYDQTSLEKFAESLRTLRNSGPTISPFVSGPEPFHVASITQNEHRFRSATKKLRRFSDPVG